MLLSSPYLEQLYSSFQMAEIGEYTSRALTAALRAMTANFQTCYQEAEPSLLLRFRL